MEPDIARKTWRTLEPLHGMIYFVPEAVQAYAALGVVGRSGYFGSRAAPLGAVVADTVIATFFNFEPGLVRAAMDGVWDRTSPGAMIEARLSAVDAALRRALDRELASAEVAEAATLARTAAEAVTDHCQGRPLAAAHADLPWPDPAHLVLWQAQSILREFRGDGHIAALVCAELDGCEALVMHAATGQVPRQALQATRAWDDDAWTAAVDRLATRGLVDADGAFTEAGRALRESIERDTDRLAVAPYRHLGEAGCDRLRELGRPLSKAVIAAGLLPF